MKSFLLVFLLCQALSLQGAIERRAALDIGSGSIKLLVADVDTETQEIAQYIYGDNMKVPFSNDLAIHPEGFSDEVQTQAKKTLATLKHRAESYGAKQVAAVATEAFRTSRNGKQLANDIHKELGIPIFIIPQSEEAEVGFESAVAHSKGNSEHAVVWDIGSGSFQISWKEDNSIQAYAGKLGKVPTKKIVLTIQGKEFTETVSPNPISKKEMNLAKAELLKKFPAIPDNLKKKLQNPLTQVYGIGAAHHANIGISLKKPFYTKTLVENVLISRLDLDDTHFGEFIVAQVSDLIFVWSLMSHLGIEEVVDIHSYDVDDIAAGGNTVGILLRQKYWPEPSLEPSFYL